MAAPDPLFKIRNNFYLGDYLSAIHYSSIRNLSQEESVQRDTIVYRSYIARGDCLTVITEIDDASAPTPLQAVKLLALHFSHQLKNKEAARSRLKEWLGDPAIVNDPMFRLIAGIVFTSEQNYDEALKFTNNAGGNMEMHALNVQIFIKMHRPDYAEKQLMIMQQIDEDHTLTKLADAWLNLALGGSKIQEAYLIFQDFAEKYEMMVLILNGKAVCYMHMGKFDEAESLLFEALKKEANNADTLVNLVVCSLHLGKQSSHYFSQLELSHPNHMLVKRASAAEKKFDLAVLVFT